MAKQRRTIDYSRADRAHAAVLNAEMDAAFEQAMQRDGWRKRKEVTEMSVNFNELPSVDDDPTVAFMQQQVHQLRAKLMRCKDSVEAARLNNRIAALTSDIRIRRQALAERQAAGSLGTKGGK